MITKGEALRRRRKCQGFTLDDFAKALGYKSYQSIANWENDEFWPDSLESAIEEKLELPRGFFGRIAEGVGYREACGYAEETELRDSMRQAIADLVAIFSRSAPESDDPDKWRDWQAHIKKQVALVRRNLLPDELTEADRCRYLAVAAEVVREELRGSKSQKAR